MFVYNKQLDFKFEASNYYEYKDDSIKNSAVYAKKLSTKQLPGLYYLIL